ncbi:flagellar biosynthetic protein FliO [Tunturiibacter gelidoferens]|jgi:flagellar biogenesis protein FliO|uniref:Flagellar biogenesis protein FliO n=1 Tax=Tunturiibacter gelidiferens TaxID=3069689 RepID=A0A9X0QI77_9BACT|nr:flagellar biosynthetic protein FliO [Edaphobacter lichenicola]MBB5330836.1 flagellar biogenesis protein FliO [Edaphobacter lichenicola]
MRFMQGVRPLNLNDAAVSEVQGLAGWVLGLAQSWREPRVSQKKQLQLVETLPLGGKRQLMLVTCAGESFLVGGSFESVETIVRLRAESSANLMADRMDDTCR